MWKRIKQNEIIGKSCGNMWKQKFFFALVAEGVAVSKFSNGPKDVLSLKC